MEVISVFNIEYRPAIEAGTYKLVIGKERQTPATVMCWDFKRNGEPCVAVRINQGENNEEAILYGYDGKKRGLVIEKDSELYIASELSEFEGEIKGFLEGAQQERGWKYDNERVRSIAERLLGSAKEEMAKNFRNAQEEIMKIMDIKLSPLENVLCEMLADYADLECPIPAGFVKGWTRKIIDAAKVPIRDESPKWHPAPCGKGCFIYRDDNDNGERYLVVNGWRIKISDIIDLPKEEG